jgi:hypothetical protein
VWYSNHKNLDKARAGAKKSSKKVKPTYLKPWGLRRVVGAVMAEEIDAKIGGVKRGSVDYLRAYPDACTKVIDNLDEEDRADLEQKAIDWNKGDVPNEMRWR